MLYFILSFILLYVGLVLYSKRWRNPYQLIFIFGRKGSGKSTLMTKMMLKDLKHGWTVYTDMKGCLIPGVREINLLHLESTTPPPYSSIYLDEVGLSMDNRQFKNFTEGLRDFYALQRHYKVKVVVNSQAFDVDKKVRDRTDKFIYQTKIAGCVGISRPIVQVLKPNDLSSPNNDSPILPFYKWGSLLQWHITWIPRYAKYFDSFVAPPRPTIQFQEVPGDLKEFLRSNRRSPASILRGFRRRR